MSNSQDLIFTLYGDYIRHRGGEAWTGTLIELLNLFGLSGQAVRSTLSRMSRKGWLKSRRASRFSFYSLTPKSVELLEEGARRIFQPRSDPWDGQWHILTYSIPESKRALRRKLRRRLLWLGFGSLNHATWISPRELQDAVEKEVDDLGIHSYVEFFSGEHHGCTSDEEIVARCWNLGQLNDYYADLIDRYSPVYEEHSAQVLNGNNLEPQACFVQRFMLIHEYRFSPYVDPNLPLELLPDDWLGGRAAELFQQYHDLLVEGAETYVDSVCAKAPVIRSS
ncbi:MAG: phenylacetic acid degradation operon negative regulatory protein PaaX [Anaerolineales bacterium]|nr:phenylacetic acid degradation operon negative regulatory protein PaaX [Anaerolineales bacterium]